VTVLPTRVVILNGPPNSGKDVLASYCSAADHSQYGHASVVRRFKESLYVVTAMLYCVDLEWLIAVANDRDQKDEYQPELGSTPREALIFTSERVVKPHYGDEWFGKKAAQSLVPGRIHWFSDGGFLSEMNPLLAAVGQENFLLVRLRRRGCSFELDSRRYLDADMCPHFCELTNDGVLCDAGDQLVTRVNEWIRETSDE